MSWQVTGLAVVAWYIATDQINASRMFLFSRDVYEKQFAFEKLTSFQLDSAGIVSLGRFGIIMRNITLQVLPFVQVRLLTCAHTAGDACSTQSTSTMHTCNYCIALSRLGVLSIYSQATASCAVSI